MCQRFSYTLFNDDVPCIATALHRSISDIRLYHTYTDTLKYGPTSIKRKSFEKDHVQFSKQVYVSQKLVRFNGGNIHYTTEAVCFAFTLHQTNKCTASCLQNNVSGFSNSTVDGGSVVHLKSMHTVVIIKPFEYQTL